MRGRVFQIKIHIYVDHWKSHHKSQKQYGGEEQSPPHGWRSAGQQATKLSALESFDLYVGTHRFQPSSYPAYYLDITQHHIWA